jgi:S-adenosylmethionine uptake transporter
MVVATAERAPTEDLPGGAVSVAMPGVVAVLVAFVGLSLGSTMAKSSGSPGAVVALWRFLIGAAVWHAVIAVRGIRTGDRCTVDATAWRLGVVPGVAFGINLSCFFSGVTLTPVAHAEFINALAPLVLIPVAALVLKERVRRHVVVCGAVALSGVLLILSPSPAAGTSYRGDLLVVASMLAWVAYLMTAKTARARVSTPQFMAVMSTVAALTTLPVALVVAGGPGGIVALSAAGWLLVSLLALVAG